MTIVNYLSAKAPLTKTISPGGDELSSYPMIRNFTSHKYNVQNIKEFRDTLIYHAGINHCLLKGQLSRDITNEPRAGLTSSMEATHFVCLDYDGEKVTADIDTLFNQIIPGFSDISRIVQYSSKAGFKPENNHRAHIFMWLSQPIIPEMLKHWLTELNMTVPILRDQIKLSSNGMALRFPLDVTTCQNDKLLYIAPPIVDGGTDPLKNRITYFQGTSDVLTPALSNNAAQMTQERHELVKQLQIASGIKPTTSKTKIVNGEELFVKSLPALITGIKQDRDYTYLNLNGGDSWGYYFPDGNPEIVRNFKGEPSMYLKDIAPDLYRELTNPLSSPQTAINIMPVAFRDIHSDEYYNALLDMTDIKIKILAKVKSKDRINDFLLQYGQTPPDIIEDWDKEFNPQNDMAFNIPNKYINTFIPTPYMKSTATRNTIPTTTEKILRHICVDQPTYDRFVNWIAFVFQKRINAQTAWLFQGTTGTGKGSLYHRILTPILGANHCMTGVLTNFDDKFNDFLEGKLLVFVDETNVDDSNNTGKIMNTIKNLITEPIIPVRRMRQSTVNVKNHCSYIFTTNNYEALKLERDDRRFNIAPRQNEKLIISFDELDGLQNELAHFADYLRGYAVDEVLVRAPLHNAAREDLIDKGQTSIDEFFSALQCGSLEYFQNFMNTGTSPAITAAYIKFKSIIDEWAIDAQNNASSRFSTKDLYDVYCATHGFGSSPAKFGRMCTHHGLNSKSVRKSNETFRGFAVLFTNIKEVA